ncbi:MAG TPA: hypothetical protein VM901_01175 [Bdellovibrionota bacterium]|nr:hypothetical protein [Bdellovibrionota bacterium]
MIAFAISYGLLTLVTLWASAGALPGAFASRVWVALAVYAVVAITLIKRNKAELSPPGVAFADTRSRLAGIGSLFIGLGYLLVLKFLFPAYLSEQSIAIHASPAAATVGLAVTLALSDFSYRRFFAPAWGPASAAFLEALTWGLATQSFVPFTWIFATGWLTSRVIAPKNALASALVRLVIGLAWITFA